MKNRTKTLVLAAVAGAVLLTSGFKASAAEIERVYGENAMSPIAAGVSVPPGYTTFLSREPCPRR